jgi:hypothetical protein
MEKLMRTINWGPAWTEESSEDGVRVLAVGGEFTPAAGERLAEHVLGLAEAGEDAFVIDLVAVEAMDPRAMVPILRAARELQSVAGRISVVFDPLLQVFAAEGLEDLYEVAVTREDALAGIRRRDPARSNGGST